jgi:isopenicillin N synthase-like dioxygenase
MSESPNKKHELVILDYADLLQAPSSALNAQLEQAYGVGSLGVLAIRNVPNFVQAKEAVLPLAHTLAHLPATYLEEELQDESSLYNAGWSFGKEKLSGDTPDTSKASFYFNPLTDTPGSADDRKQYPASYPCNKWPTAKLPQLEPACKTIGAIMKGAVVELTKHVDAYIVKTKKDDIEYDPPTLLYDAMVETEKAKGRLLYYFPTTSTKDDSWIGWHADSGFLTALAGDMYVDHTTGEAIPCPDPNAGLYVATPPTTTDTEEYQIHRVDIPFDCMAVQVGECVQLVTGGALVATPHCVRGASNVPNVARISLPCFIDTPPTFPIYIPKGCTRDEALHKAYSRVPPLGARWTKDGMTFGDFLGKTFSTYYEWSK